MHRYHQIHSTEYQYQHLIKIELFCFVRTFKKKKKAFNNERPLNGSISTMTSRDSVTLRVGGVIAVSRRKRTSTALHY